MKKLLTGLLIVVIIIGCFSVIVNGMKAPEPVSYERYVVEKGDTLWGIARQSDMWNKIDASYIIDDMQEKSNCTALIYPGQVVYIPMYND